MMKKKSNAFKSLLGKPMQVGATSCTIEDIIAEGGFALVFLARTTAGQKGALKRMFVNNEADLEVAKRELAILKTLCGHKNIVKHLDSHIRVAPGGDPTVFEVLLLTEFCPGGVIADMNRLASQHNSFSECEILRIFCDVCEGLSRLHHAKTPIIHRDIKVENVLYNGRHYVLCDFGSATNKTMNPTAPDANIASMEEEIKKYTTLAYRAPEMTDLYCGKPITLKADIWALGCLLYKLCFFNVPFGESILAIQSASLTFPDRSKFSEKLLNIISYILKVDPNERPDIYQVAYLAFELCRKQNPVANVNNSPIPRIEVSQQSQERPKPPETAAPTVEKVAAPSGIGPVTATGNSAARPGPSTKIVQSQPPSKNSQTCATDVKSQPNQLAPSIPVTSVQSESAPQSTDKGGPQHSSQPTKADDLMSFTESARSAAHQHVQRLVNSCHVPQSSSQPFSLQQGLGAHRRNASAGAVSELRLFSGLTCGPNNNIYPQTFQTPNANQNLNPFADQGDFGKLAPSEQAKQDQQEDVFGAAPFSLNPSACPDFRPAFQTAGMANTISNSTQNYSTRQVAENSLTSIVQCNSNNFSRSASVVQCQQAAGSTGQDSATSHADLISPQHHHWEEVTCNGKDSIHQPTPSSTVNSPVCPTRQDSSKAVVQLPPTTETNFIASQNYDPSSFAVNIETEHDLVTPILSHSLYEESLQEKFPCPGVEIDGLGTSSGRKASGLALPQNECDEDSSFYSSSDDESDSRNSSDFDDYKQTAGKDPECGRVAAPTGSEKGNMSEGDFQSDSSAEFFASSGYVRLQTKNERVVKNAPKKALQADADCFGNSHLEHSSLDGGSSSDHEELMHQQLLLEPTRNDSCSGSSSDDEAESLNNIPWLYKSGDESKTVKLTTKRNLNVSYSNPFGKRYGGGSIQSSCDHSDDVFRLAPFPRLNWDLLNCAADQDSVSNQCGESADSANRYEEASIEKNVFANAPWTYVMKFNDEEEEGAEKENVFDGAPLGCLSLIVPLTLSQ